MVNKATAGTDYTTNAYWTRVLQSIPASYTVWNDSGTYRAESNLSTGADASGTDASTVIQLALDGLTAGRTWFEKVVLRGNFPINTSLTPSAYSVLEGGRLELNANIAQMLYLNANNLMIKDMVLEGNYATKTGSGIIGTNSANNVWVENCYISHFSAYCLYLDGNVNTVVHNYITEANKPLTFGGADSYFGFNSIGGAGQGALKIGLYLPSIADSLFVGNKIFTCDDYLVYMDAPHDVTFVGNVLGSTTNYDGIYIASATADCGQEITITGNTFYAFGRNAIRLQGNQVKYNTITGNIFDSGAAKWSIVEVDGTEDYNQVIGNIVKTGNGFYLLGAHDSVDESVMATASLDLSGGATDIIIYQATSPCYLIGYSIFYSEASSADAGVSIDIGRYQSGVALDDDYFDTTTSEVSKSLGYSKYINSSALTNIAVSAGDTITVGTAGGKVGTGEVRIILKIAHG